MAKELVPEEISVKVSKKPKRPETKNDCTQGKKTL